MPRPVRYRRSPHVVCYWKDDRFVFHNYAWGTVKPASAVACGILDFFSGWKSADAFYESRPDVRRGTLRRALDAMVRARLLQRSDREPSRQERAMASMDRWNPEAGFFHSATRDVAFTSRAAAERQLREQAKRWPMPPPVKNLRGVRTVPLPRLRADGPVSAALLARRTWRRFGRGSIPLETFGNLLGLTAGVQRWVIVPAHGRLALKTSPSGGARHPVEVYVLAWRIAGLAKGLYHYAPDRHALELLRPGLDSRRVPRYLPDGGYWSDACALLLFTAVYERNLWRYGYSRAYRAPLIEAGHLCQTFCVLASAHELAPFSAMGLADSLIERDLGLDGVSESVLYAAGVGIRPAGERWAPAPRGLSPPKTIRNPTFGEEP